MGMWNVRGVAAALAGAACLTFAAAGAAPAQDFPSRPLTIVVPYPPASVPDIMTRLIADHMRVNLGQAITIENKPGAGGSIGMAQVARAAPDGYTIAMAGSPNVLAMHTAKSPGFELFTDFAPIGRMNSLINVVSVNAKLPIKTFDELIKYAKANPGKLNYAHSGPATPTDMGGRQFAQVYGLDIQFVGYKGSTPAAQALASGEADMSIISVGVIYPHLQSGAVRPLTIATPVKWAMMPEIPSADQSGMKVNFDGWCGLVVPTGTPAPVIAKLNAALNYALAQDNVKKGADQAGGSVLPGTPEDLTKLMKNDFEITREMVRVAGVQKQ